MMNWTPTRRSLLKGTAALAATAPFARVAFADDIPTAPEAGDIKMGIEPWLGYGQWHIAAKKDLFKAQGLGNVIGAVQTHGMCHFFQALLTQHGFTLGVKAHHGR